MTPEQRAAVCAEAESWLGTPFRHCACLKSVGTDCAQLLVGVARNSGIAPRDFGIDKYNWQHSLHSSEELYVEQLLKFMQEIPESEAQPGDVVLYRSGRTFAHAGWIIEPWPGKIVHAIRGSGVVAAHGLKDAAVQGRQRRFFTAKDLSEADTRPST